jgi:hypothetical protein
VKEEGRKFHGRKERKKGKGKKGKGRERKKNLERFAGLIPGDAVTFHGLAIKSARAFSGKNWGRRKRP